MIPEFIEENKVYLTALIDTCGRFYVLESNDESPAYYLKPELHFDYINKDVTDWLKSNFPGAYGVLRTPNGIKITNLAVINALIQPVAEGGKFKKGSASAMLMLMKLDLSLINQRAMAVQIATAINKAYEEDMICKPS